MFAVFCFVWPKTKAEILQHLSHFVETFLNRKVLARKQQQQQNGEVCCVGERMANQGEEGVILLVDSSDSEEESEGEKTGLKENHQQQCGTELQSPCFEKKQQCKQQCKQQTTTQRPPRSLSLRRRPKHPQHATSARTRQSSSRGKTTQNEDQPKQQRGGQKPEAAQPGGCKAAASSASTRCHTHTTASRRTHAGLGLLSPELKKTLMQLVPSQAAPSKRATQPLTKGRHAFVHPKIYQIFHL